MSPTVSFGARMNGEPVRLHYAIVEGRPIFAGWDEQKTRADLADNMPARPMFALDPLRAYEHGLLGFVGPGGESAPKLPQYESGEQALGQRLADLIVAQLRMGPQSLADNTARDAFNEFLGQDMRVPAGAAITESEWLALIGKALSYSVDQAPAFDSRGLRKFSAVHADAAALLGIDLTLYYEWKGVVGEDELLEGLGLSEVRRVWPAGGVDLKELLQSSLRDELGFRAAVRLGAADALATLPRPEEIALQWEVAGISMIDDTDEKVAAAFDLVKSQAEQGNIAAGRALALIVSHSDVNDAAASIDRWKTAELKRFFVAVMQSKARGVASHRSFRQYLSAAQNDSVNGLVSFGNVGHVTEALRDIDVTKVSDADFWNAYDSATGDSGQDFFLDHVAEEMARSFFGETLRRKPQ